MKMNKIYGALSVLLLSLTACSGGAKKESESSPKESEPAQSEPAESEPAESEPGESEPAESEPGESEEESEPAESEPEPVDYVIEEPTTITFLNTLSYTTQINNMIESFKKLQPNVTVVNEKISGSYDKIKEQTIADIQTGEYADLVLCYPDHVVDYIYNSIAVQVDDYMDNKTYGWTEEEKEDIVPAFMEEGQAYPVEGTWSLPFCKSTEAMYYNEDVLIGLDLRAQDPDLNGGKALTHDYLNNLTWDELFDRLCPAIAAYNDALPEGDKIIKASQIKKKDESGSEIIVPGKSSIIGYDAVDNLFITLCEQYGYGYTSLDPITGEANLDWADSAELRQLVKKFNAAYQAGYFLTKSTNDNNYINTMFTQQACLFSIGSTGGIKYQFDNGNPMRVGVAKVPQANPKKPQLISQGPSVCITTHGTSKEAENKKLAAWLFYKHMIEEDNCLMWVSNTGYTPVRDSVYESEGYIEYSTFDPEEADEASLDRLTAYNAKYTASVLENIFVNPAFKGSSTSRSQVGALLTNIMTEENLTDEIVDSLFNAAAAKVRLDM